MYTIAMGEFTLKELAAASGESERTIRFYQQRGLLRQPGQIGPGAHYDASDRLRLLLIRRLQAEGLTLTEIAARFATLDDAAIRDEALRHGSAIDYVRSVLGESPHAVYSVDSQAGPPPTPQPASPLSPPPTAQWERIEVTPGIELHVKHPISAARRRAIAAYVARAQNEIEGES
jgi:DNA-binding transcriptional MerR regulator